MKVLFAVSNESISESIVKKYQKDYKEIISYKNVYYFNAILKEIQRDKSYDRIVISEDLEPFANNDYDAIDRFIFEKLDSITDEAIDSEGGDTPIILICSDRREKAENILVKLFGIGIYDAILGQDRSIEQVCKLIKKPRTKKEAKIYYKIEAEDVNYQSETEDSVSETEIQNILAHYKKLGKNEEAYVESFNNIAAQYTDTQLKVITKFLPLNVRAVLEINSPKYQSIMAFTGKKTVVENKKEKEHDSGLKINFIENQTGKPKLSKPIVVPTAVNTKQVKKIEETENTLNEIQPEPIQVENIEEKVENNYAENQQITENEIEAPKKGRGRPKKVQEEVDEETPKKRRGRPKKVQEDIEDETVNLFNLANETDGEKNNQENNILPGFENELENNSYSNSIMNVQNQSSNIDLENLITKDKKIVCFVGTTKNGTSFLINNLAQIFSNMGIKTAILDMTKNKNSYYIYTKNEEELRKIAYTSIEKLAQGVAEGINVNQNLAVYTSLPREEKEMDCKGILATLIKNYSLVLIDCDFTTPAEYFRNSGEIYLVQSLDILTIQPLTDFLRDLKSNDALPQEKIKVVINKDTRVRGLNPKVLIGGMAFYNDPAMSFMTELFNKDLIKYRVIPFNEQVYCNYMEGIVNCKISTSGYPKAFMKDLKDLGNMVYPLLSNKYRPVDSYERRETFSSDTNNTLEQMKRNY